LITVGFMDESLRGLSAALGDDDGALTLASMLCEMVGLQRRILNCGSPNHAKLSAIARLIDEFAPPPGPGDDAIPQSRGGPAAAAAIIAGELRDSPGPATATLERFAQDNIILKNTEDRDTTDSERRRLRVRPGETVRARNADLYTAGGIHVASVQLAVIPGRLPPDVADSLDSDVPFGTLAAPHRPARRARVASDCYGGLRVAIRSAALLVFSHADLPAAAAGEHVTREFCDHIAAIGWLRYTFPRNSLCQRKCGPLPFSCGHQRRGGGKPGARGVLGTRPRPPRRLRPGSNTDRRRPRGRRLMPPVRRRTRRPRLHAPRRPGDDLRGQLQRPPGNPPARPRLPPAVLTIGRMPLRDDEEMLRIVSTRGPDHEPVCMLTWGPLQWYAPVAGIREAALDMLTCAAYAEFMMVLVTTVKLPPHVVNRATGEMLAGRDKPYFGTKTTVTMIPAGDSRQKQPLVLLKRGARDGVVTAATAREMALAWLETAAGTDSDQLLSAALREARIGEDQQDMLFALLMQMRAGRDGNDNVDDEAARLARDSG
jgi:hypothetical protein